MKEGKLVLAVFRNFASCPGLVLVTPGLLVIFLLSQGYRTNISNSLAGSRLRPVLIKFQAPATKTAHG